MTAGASYRCSLEPRRLLSVGMMEEKTPPAVNQLRLLLTTVKSKDEKLAAARRPFRRQLNCPIAYAMQGNSLDARLNIMKDIGERSTT